MMHLYRPTYQVKVFVHVNLSYEPVKKNTLKQISVSPISTAKYIYDTIYIIVDYRFDIFAFIVNRCDVIDTLLPH